MKIIYITIATFILTYLINTISFLFSNSENFIINWFALSPDFDQWISKPWSLISYGFLHDGFIHIFFNLLILYYFGNLFLNFFNKNKFLVYYILGIIFGGIIFILSYNYLPALQTRKSILVGASAGVTAVLVGLATHIPNYAMHFQFIGKVKLKIIAIVIIVFDLVQIPAGNAGGHLAHLGGALVGFLLTNNFNQGEDLVNWFSHLFRPKQKKPLKTVYKNKKSTYTRSDQKDEEQRRIDAILDKISKSGYDALNKEEKDFLFKAGKK